MIYSKFFSFNEINWALHSEEKSTVDDLLLDYGNFEIADRANFHFEIYIQKNGINSIGTKRLIKGKNYLFSIGWKRRYFQFNDRLFGLELIESSRTLTIFGSNFLRLREVVLSYVNSVLGELNDKKGWHRLHATGIHSTNHLESLARVVPLNSGEGKSSFTFWASQQNSIQILSDETIFTNGKKVRGFFTRLALRVQPTVPSVVYIRQGHSPKYLVSLGQEQLENRELPFILWLPRNKWTYPGFFITFIFGLGNAQMFEFMVRPDNILGLLYIFVRRIFTMIRILKKCRFKGNWSSFEPENFKVLESLE